MSLSVLLLLAASVAGEADAPAERALVAPPPAPAPAAPEPTRIPWNVTVSGGPLRGELFGLDLKGGGLHLAFDRPAGRAGERWTGLLELGAGFTRSRTPEGLAVTDVAADLGLGVGWRAVRAGAGLTLAFLSVERVTGTGGDLRGFHSGGVATLSVDALRAAGTVVLVEVRGSGLLGAGWRTQVDLGLRF